MSVEEEDKSGLMECQEAHRGPQKHEPPLCLLGREWGQEL